MIRHLGNLIEAIDLAEERNFQLVSWCKIACALAFASVVWAVMDCVWPPASRQNEYYRRPATCPPEGCLVQHLPATSIMQAVATNDRRVAGARCHGDLVGPTVRMLA